MVQAAVNFGRLREIGNQWPESHGYDDLFVAIFAVGLSKRIAHSCHARPTPQFQSLQCYSNLEKTGILFIIFTLSKQLDERANLGHHETLRTKHYRLRLVYRHKHYPNEKTHLLVHLK